MRDRVQYMKRSTVYVHAIHDQYQNTRQKPTQQSQPKDQTN